MAGTARTPGSGPAPTGTARPARAAQGRHIGRAPTDRTDQAPTLAARCVEILRNRRADQDRQRTLDGAHWTESDPVFASETGTELDAANVRRGFRQVLAAAGLPAKEWTPRELRHSLVSLLSDGGVTLDQIARLVGHPGVATWQSRSIASRSDR